MTKRKPTKHEDDILRNIRQPDRYDPKARSFGGPWRMVKCKDGAYVCYEQHMEIIDNLRKNAEIDPAQSPHDGIHTCSKGCKKQGCNRGLRDTIEEQDAQIVALKQDLLEQSAAARHLRVGRIHDLNHIGGLQEENARLKAEMEALMTTPCSRLLRAERDEVSRLKAEVERLTHLANQSEFYRSQLQKDTCRLENIQMQDAFKHYESENARLKAEVERLRKAGDWLADAMDRNGCHDNGDWQENNNCIYAWNAAKEGKQS